MLVERRLALLDLVEWGVGGHDATTFSVVTADAFAMASSIFLTTAALRFCAGVVARVTFLTATTDSSGNTTQVPGFNFAIPSTIIKQFLSESDITPTQGQLTKTYHEAVDLAADSHYSAAKDKFKEVADANPTYPYVSDQIAAATSKINDGQDKSTFPIPTWLIIVLVVIVVIIGAAGAAYFFLIRKK